MISDLVAKGAERIASGKKLTSQDLSVPLLYEQSTSISRLGKGMEEMAGELREVRKEAIPLPNQARDIAAIRARIERIEAKVGG